MKRHQRSDEYKTASIDPTRGFLLSLYLDKAGWIERIAQGKSVGFIIILIVIEDHQEIGTPVHCGECISDIAVSNLDLELPQEVISKRVHGIRVIFPVGRQTHTLDHLLALGQISNN